jgi:hypothetical protein
MLQLKYGVVVAGNEYTNAIMRAVQLAYKKYGLKEVVLSAGRDGKHGPKSYHYLDRALDIRFWTVKEEDRGLVAGYIKAELPPFYDVVVESDHYHIEADAAKEKLWLNSSPKST